MTKDILHLVSAILLMFSLSCCGKSDKRESAPKEDEEAKAMLEGIWLDSESDNVTFRVKGDTIYYPNPTNQPVKFVIIQDTMVLQGSNVSRYPVIRQSEYLFVFKNQNGDIVKLVKSDNAEDTLLFAGSQPVVLNQEVTIKKDSVVSYGGEKFHCYIQVNPTLYKVYRSFGNDEGIEVENVYYDNIIHVSIYSGTNKNFSKDFRKDDFRMFVPDNMIKQIILSDIRFLNLDEDGFHYFAQLAIPESPSSFIIYFTISYKGKISMGISD